MKKFKVASAILYIACMSIILISVFIPSLKLVGDESSNKDEQFTKSLFLEMVSDKEAEENALDKEVFSGEFFTEKLNGVSFIKNCFSIGFNLIRNSRFFSNPLATLYLALPFIVAGTFFLAGIIILFVRIFKTILRLISVALDKKPTQYVESPGISSVVFFYVAVQIIQMVAFQFVYDYSWNSFPIRFVFVNNLNYLVLFSFAVAIKIIDEILISIAEPKVKDK